MTNKIQVGGKRMRKTTTAEAICGAGKQESLPAELQSASARPESEADRLLRKIFFRSGPLPVAPYEG